METTNNLSGSLKDSYGGRRMSGWVEGLIDYVRSSSGAAGKAAKDINSKKKLMDELMEDEVESKPTGTNITAKKDGGFAKRMKA